MPAQFAFAFAPFAELDLFHYADHIIIPIVPPIHHSSQHSTLTIISCGPVRKLAVCALCVCVSEPIRSRVATFGLLVLSGAFSLTFVRLIPLPPFSGRVCLGPSTFASIALILSIFANLRCNLITADVFGGSGYTNAPDSVGLWCYEINGAYYDARDINVDSKYQAARALGLTTDVLGWIIVIFYLVAGCQPFPPKAFMLVGMLCTLNCLFQGLVFLVFKSKLCESGCSLDTGGRCAIAACVFWFVAGKTSLASGRDAEQRESNEARSAPGAAADEEQN